MISQAPELLMEEEEKGSNGRSMPADIYALGMVRILVSWLIYNEY